MSVEQHSIKRISRFYTQLHRLKTLKWKSVQWIGGFFNVWKVWRKAKEVLPLTSLMGTNGLQGCWSRNQVSIVTGFSSLIYSPSTNWLNKGQLPKVHFPQGFFPDKFQLLPPVVPTRNLMSSSIQMHRSAMHLHQSSLEKLTVHQTCWIWTIPEIKPCKSTNKLDIFTKC